MMRSFGPALRAGLFLVLAGVAVPSFGATLEVGEDKQYKSPSEAIAAAADGDKILIQPGEYFDCAIVKQSDLTIEGAKPDGSAVLSDKACQGKGLLVTQGDDIVIRNLTLTRARVPDHNGAGIRAEGTNLTVDNVKFINNENGILGAPNPKSTITVINSEFSRNGGCNPSCAHGIYVNALKLLHVEKTKFIEQKTAHHLKSRAARTEVINCEFRDNATGTASYEIEAPNGGSLIVRGTSIEKGPKAENHSAAIMVGSEGITQATKEIVVENNTFVNDGAYDTVLLENRSAQEAVVKGNKISGRAKPLRGDGEVD